MREQIIVKILNKIDKKKTDILWDCRGDSSAELYHTPTKKFNFLKKEFRKDFMMQEK